MVISTPEDAPRGMEFIYNASRLNVADYLLSLLFGEPAVEVASLGVQVMRSATNGTVD